MASCEKYGHSLLLKFALSLSEIQNSRKRWKSQEPLIWLAVGSWPNGCAQIPSCSRQAIVISISYTSPLSSDYCLLRPFRITTTPRILSFPINLRLPSPLPVSSILWELYVIVYFPLLIILKAILLFLRSVVSDNLALHGNWLPLDLQNMSPANNIK